ncbi:MAG: PDDEXK nuclease domain-containing protein [Gallionella sp.]|nr:PDDEXK nuclease domain-containing protein [Gallionella sp.]
MSEDISTSLTLAVPEGYADWLKQLKTDIARAQQRAALSVNAELVQLYGRIGRDILQRQDAQIKADDDHPTIGLLLCKKQNRLVAEYALSGIDKPIGVAEYQLLRDLPEQLGKILPSIAEIEAELAGELGSPNKIT